VKATLTDRVLAPPSGATNALALAVVIALIFVFPGYAQEPARAADPKIAAALKEVSAARIHANIDKLCSHRNRIAR
jgi:hypothetical protein